MMIEELTILKVLLLPLYAVTTFSSLKLKVLIIYYDSTCQIRNTTEIGSLSFPKPYKTILLY